MQESCANLETFRSSELRCWQDRKMKRVPGGARPRVLAVKKSSVFVGHVMLMRPSSLGVCAVVVRCRRVIQARPQLLSNHKRPKAARDQTIVELVHSRSARSGTAKSSKLFVVVPSGMQPVQRPCSRVLATSQCSSKARSLAALVTTGLIYSQCETTPMLRNVISKNKRETCKQLRQQHRNALKHERVQTRRRYLRRTRGGGAPTTSKLTQPV